MALCGSASPEKSSSRWQDRLRPPMSRLREPAARSDGMTRRPAIRQGEPSRRGDSPREGDECRYDRLGHSLAARTVRPGPMHPRDGGVGGVHRGAAESFDVSTDLDELARSDGSMVVCSGSKSILDLAATLEVLETLGVAVVGYRTGEFPAFTTVSSGLPLEHRVETAGEAAAILRRRIGSLASPARWSSPTPCRPSRHSIATYGGRPRRRDRTKRGDSASPARPSRHSSSRPSGRRPVARSLRANGPARGQRPPGRRDFSDLDADLATRPRTMTAIISRVPGSGMLAGSSTPAVADGAPASEEATAPTT